MNWIRDELPYSVDPFAWFASVRDRPWPVILESRGCSGQRFDIIAADPAIIISARDDVTTVAKQGREYTSNLDPFSVVQQEVADRQPDEPCPVDSVFTGGAIGYFGYELARHVERLPEPPVNDLDMPDMLVGIYDWFIVIDHLSGRAMVLSSPRRSKAEHDSLRRQLDTVAGTGLKPFSAGPVSSNFSRQQYNAAVKRIKSYIFAGDCYQVNLAQRFMARFEGDPVALYQTLRNCHTAPFSACLAFPGHQVLSFSPERFLRVRDGDVLTEPIKGTRSRGETKAEDERLAQELMVSEKDKAENLMIVDLLRNDLGRCCEPGSIHVESLFQLRSFPNVHHLVSAVRGHLRAGQSAIDLLKACFPGGSITGAPKVRAMEIIRELEPARRYAYCGAIGYYDYNGNMDTNLAIRTIVCGNGQVCFWGGGGIVADSTADAEYQESLDKVNMIARAISPDSNNFDRINGAAQDQHG
ncbi:MAG: aminodeoxychorismate synthase component I [Pseudomonadales bacterium]